MNNIVALSIEYWTTHYEIKSLHNLNRLIEFYKSILDKGTRDLEYSERHHMIPASMNIDNILDKNNIIVMTAKEHFIAHLILSKCFSGINSRRMSYALLRMTQDSHGNRYIVSAKMYERIKLQYSINCSGSNNVMYNRKHTEEFKKRISESNRTRKLPDDYMKGSKNPCYGKKLYHKDNEQKYLLPEQIEEYEANGWMKGGLKFTEEHRERISKAVKGKKKSKK